MRVATVITKHLLQGFILPTIQKWRNGLQKFLVALSLKPAMEQFQCQVFGAPNLEALADYIPEQQITTAASRIQDCINQHGVLNGSLLLSKKMLKLKFENDQELDSFEPQGHYDTTVNQANNAYHAILYGQINSENVLDGIGRKIELYFPYHHGKYMDYGEFAIFEGQFANGKLNGFGRCFTNYGGVTTGWYDDDQLNGYAIRVYKGEAKEGMFQKDVFMPIRQPGDHELAP